MVIGYHGIFKFCALNIPQNLIYTTGLATHWIPFILNGENLHWPVVLLLKSREKGGPSGKSSISEGNYSKSNIWFN